MSEPRELRYETAADRYPRKRKGVTATRIAKRRRAEDAVAKTVRELCVERDVYCRACFNERIRDVRQPDHAWLDCEGPSQWCHMHARRRSKTRNMAPEIRHDTAYSFMACQKHHDQYDNKRTPRLFVTALTSKGANGPLKFRVGK